MERLSIALCVFICMSCIYRYSSAVDCAALLSTTVTNGNVTTTGLTTGSTATYSCDTGYTLSGTATRTCAVGGTWIGAAPTCKKANCDALKSAVVTNGEVSTDGTATGSTATYSCDTGYTLSSTATRKCEAGGTWNGVAPTCNKDSFGGCTGDPKACPVKTIHTECVKDKCVCSDGYYKDGESCAAEDPDNFAVATSLTIPAMIATLAVHLFF